MIEHMKVNLKSMKRGIALLLAGMLLLTGCGAKNRKDETPDYDQAAAASSASESGLPSGSIGAAESEAGKPGNTESETTGSENTEEAASLSESSETETTSQGDSESEPAQPGETQPAETKPAETKPTETKPAETKPAETKPAETKPAETKPAETKPAETKPAETKPAGTKPAETKPAGTKPAETKPAETKPAETKPAETRPADVTANKTGNLFKNPCFTDGSSYWTEANGSSAIVTATAGRPIVSNLYTYGIIKRDPSGSQPYDCFAQDITAQIENGQEYEFEFYAMLSDDYKGAPADQRTLTFSPYYVLNGETSYLGDYSAEIGGTSSQVLTPGVWTKYSGTFQLSCSRKPEKVVIRILEQGTDWGSGKCVKGDYCLTGISLRKTDKKPAIVQTDIPNLKDSIASGSGLGNGTIVGCAVSGDMSDQKLCELVQKHFNAVTIGNELKPDCHFFYSNDRCPGTQEYTLNGQKVVMPKVTFASAERLLDVVLRWNQANPNAKIRVRGHVLVWHSQTPEWFFHRDFDASKPYVSKEEMNIRQEWYIKTILEHYVGAGSKYKDLFYGWDVVNEAVSDGRSDYRNASEGSSWWAVYRSEEFIVNAFKYANKYAPANLELYYNDYNDCMGGKVEGIKKLLKAVKAAEGAPGVGTRIDGMGMQAHYWEGHPSQTEMQNAVRAYCRIVGKVQITEWDLRASGSYNGSAGARRGEYIRMANQYKQQYDTLKRLNAESGVTISGITFWGTIDKYSWLRSAQHVGGSETEAKKQCPLLFDDDYQAKPAFWAFVDPSKINQ